MKSSTQKPERRRNTASRPAESDPELLLSEELKLQPMSIHLENQVRQLRRLEKALYKAGQPSDKDRREAKSPFPPPEMELTFSPWQRNKYLIPLKVPLALQAGELCYLRSAAKWQNISDIEVSSDQLPDPALPSKHLSIRRRGETPDHPMHLSEGTVSPGFFYLTNRRIIMSCADKRRLSINLRSAYRRTVYRNAIEIQHMDHRLGRAFCDNFFLSDKDIEFADSLFQCFG